MSRRIPIRFDPWYKVLSTVLGLSPSSSYVEVSGDQIHVRMGWAFRATFPKNAVASTETAAIRPLSRGVHGFAGRWLVNGAGDRILTVALDPVQRCHMLGLSLSLRELMVSVDDPAALGTLLEGKVV